jgi:hypothetical protein
MFGSLKIQDGPAPLEAGKEPVFPNDKRMQYASRREQEQKQRNDSKSSSVVPLNISPCTKNHTWVPHFGGGSENGLTVCL